MRGGLSREIKRKSFHLLTLVYWGLYLVWGRERLLPAMNWWMLAVAVAELGRLFFPKINDRLMAPFLSFHRPEEKRRPSGIFYSSMGSWITILAFGRQPAATQASLLFLSLGDAAAALVGQSWGWGLLRVAGRRKSLSGSLACFGVCWAAAWMSHLPPRAIWGGSLAATLIEFLPLPLNDNLWMPIGSAWVLSALI